MAGMQYTDVQPRPTECPDLTRLTLDEFEQLIPPFETEFQAHMARWRLDVKPYTTRQFAVHKICSLPPPQDRLFFPTDLFQDLGASGGPGTSVRHGSEQSQ